jgi:hypothetical protein
MELLFIAGAGRVADADFADLPVIDAPAATHNRSTWEIEQLLKVGPGLVRQRPYLKHGCSFSSIT